MALDSSESRNRFDTKQNTVDAEFGPFISMMIINSPSSLALILLIAIDAASAAPLNLRSLQTTHAGFPTPGLGLILTPRAPQDVFDVTQGPNPDDVSSESGSSQDILELAQTSDPDDKTIENASLQNEKGGSEQGRTEPKRQPESTGDDIPISPTRPFNPKDPDFKVELEHGKTGGNQHEEEEEESKSKYAVQLPAPTLPPPKKNSQLTPPFPPPTVDLYEELYSRMDNVSLPLPLLLSSFHPRLIPTLNQQTHTHYHPRREGGKTKP